MTVSLLASTAWKSRSEVQFGRGITTGKSVLTQQVEKMRQLGLIRFSEEADRADRGSGRDQSFEVNGKIAASANIGSNRP
ncbi:hypothetical protein ACOJBO_10210 [Rhizobium beringeri]